MKRGPTVLAALIATTVGIGCGGGGGSSTAAGGSSTRTPASSGEVRLEKIGDFEQPVYVTQPPGDDDLYVVEREGTVRIVRDGRTLSEPALDIRDRVDADGEEQGLLSIAFPPDFQTSGLAYAYFTGNDQDQYVFEYRVRDDGTIDPASARQVLHMDDFASNHNGGLLLFGPDRRLYIGTGDGGIADDPERNGQNLGSLLGKILRIDPRRVDAKPYSVPAENPFAGRSGARPEICDYGLRNPWRFSFDRESGNLVIGDVGQDTQEEIDFLPAGRACGANFGWSAFEGTNRFNHDQTAPNAVSPMFTYGRDRGCSVTGGYVVRDPSLPAVAGRYVYGDFCEGRLRTLVPAARARDDRSLDLEVPGLSSFGEDNAGHVYAVSLEGPVYRLAE